MQHAVAIAATGLAQQAEVKPQGTSAFSPGLATGVANAVGGAVVVVAVSPNVISSLSTVGALPLPASCPSAVAKVPAATSAAPAASNARVFVECNMMVRLSLFSWARLGRT
jgi:hypothetical protein